MPYGVRRLMHIRIVFFHESAYYFERAYTTGRENTGGNMGSKRGQCMWIKSKRGILVFSLGLLSPLFL